MRRKETAIALQSYSKILLFIGLFCVISLGISYYPQPRNERDLVVQLVQERPGELLPENLPTYLLRVDYQVLFSNTKKVWLGDVAQISMNVKPVIKSQLADVYKQNGEYQMFLEGRLDWDMGELSPGKVILESLQPGKSAIFFWQVKPSRSGDQNGKVWLTLNIHSEGDEVAWRQTRLVLPIELQVERYFGLPVTWARGLFISVLIFCFLALLIPPVVNILHQKSGE